MPEFPWPARAGRSALPGRLSLRMPGLLAAVAVLIAATAAGCASTAAPGLGAAVTSAAVPAEAYASLQAAFTAAIKEVLPSVVEIRTSYGLGSGVVFDSSGDIVTNAHVVGQATSMQVIGSSSAEPVPATLVGVYRPDDLAVIRVSDATGLRPAVFGNSADLVAGDIVLAIGNPLGLDSSVTEGIVSAVGRTVSEPGVGRLGRCHAAGHDPDVGRDQPGQQWRRACHPRRRGGGHPHAGRSTPSGRRGAGDRIRDPVQHRHRNRPPTRGHRPRDQSRLIHGQVHTIGRAAGSPGGRRVIWPPNGCRCKLLRCA